MNKFNFDKVLQKLEQVKSELPKELANDAQKYFNNSFRQQGWEGEQWKVPQRRIEGTNAYKYPKNKKLGRRTSATLVRSGRLRRTVATSLKRATFQSIKWIVDLPYAAVHNEGGKVEVGAHKKGWTKYKTTVETGLKQSKKTGKYYMGKSTKTYHIKTDHISVSAHTKDMPKRKFMGDSENLRKLQRKKIKKVINTIWRA